MPVFLDFAVLPLLVGVGLLRVQLCRRYQPLPVRRVVDLLRVAAVALAVCLVTETAKWVAVALDRHRGTWAAVTSGQVVVLGVLTASTISSWVLVRRADRAVAGVAHPAAQPDRLADALALALRVTRLLGRYRGSALHGVRSTNSQVIAARAYPGAAAGLLAGVRGALRDRQDRPRGLPVTARVAQHRLPDREPVHCHRGGRRLAACRGPTPALAGGVAAPGGGRLHGRDRSVRVP